uniref:Uncharacterized protein n=1 Tax=Romanomermis culicivorax TaxID=13658 RepID=A0A915KMZ4_ROMCU
MKEFLPTTCEKGKKTDFDRQTAKEKLQDRVYVSKERAWSNKRQNGGDLFLANWRKMKGKTGTRKKNTNPSRKISG